MFDNKSHDILCMVKEFSLWAVSCGSFELMALGDCADVAEVFILYVNRFDASDSPHFFHFFFYIYLLVPVLAIWGTFTRKAPQNNSRSTLRSSKPFAKS